MNDFCKVSIWVKELQNKDDIYLFSDLNLGLLFPLFQFYIIFSIKFTESNKKDTFMIGKIFLSAIINYFHFNSIENKTLKVHFT